jgi:hypothetical protein
MGLIQDLGVEKMLRECDSIRKRLPRKHTNGVVVVSFTDRSKAKSQSDSAKLAGMHCFSFSSPPEILVFASSDEERLGDMLMQIIESVGEYDHIKETPMMAR